MLTKLTLDNFKNFQHAELQLGSFTVLIGANAAGKSNIREAFRFLHGIGRGYTLPDIIGEKWLEGGVRVWNGIRGGTQEIIYQHFNFDPFRPMPYTIPGFTIEVDFGLQGVPTSPSSTYDICVALTKPDNGLSIHTEKLSSNGQNLFAYQHTDSESLNIEFADCSWNESGRFYQPFLSSEWMGILPTGGTDKDGKLHWIDEKGAVRQQVQDTLKQLKPLRFFDFVPDTLRKPSFSGQLVLGDSGENFSSVLHAICQNSQQKEILLSWVEDLTPMDAVDFEFPSDQIGRILVTVVERNGQRISAYSMSDGTLRFLAILAAFLGPERAKFYFLEELENGIHPTRLHLLTQFIENQVAQGDIQVVATTHSPLLLNYLKPKTLENASLLYRLEDQPDAHIKRIMDIPNARQLIEKQSVMRLYESGWFENSMFFLDDDTEDVA